MIKICPFWPSGPAPLSKEAEIILKRYLPSARIETDCIIEPSPPQKLPYLAFSDSFRMVDYINHIKEVVLERQIDILWAVRGGYGAMRWAECLVELMLSLRETVKPPVIIGFSDVTFIHLALFKHKITSIHGPMLNTLHKTDKVSLEAMSTAIQENAFPCLNCHPVSGWGMSRGRNTVKGRIVGGNLSCIAASLGTPFEPQWEDAILIMEDINDPPYKIDRMLTQLKLNNIFLKVKGIGFGSFLCKGYDNDAFNNVIIDKMSSFKDVPCVFHLPFGHGKDNLPLLIGGEYELSPNTLSYAPIIY